MLNSNANSQVNLKAVVKAFQTDIVHHVLVKEDLILQNFVESLVLQRFTSYPALDNVYDVALSDLSFVEKTKWLI